MRQVVFPYTITPDLTWIVNCLREIENASAVNNLPDGFPTSVREKILANRTYFVSTTGSDSNNGLSGTTPFRNIQTGINAAASLDLGTGFLVGVSVAAGTYFETLTLPSYVGTGPIVVTGNPAVPGNVIIDASALGNPFPIFANGNLTNYNFNGFRLITSAGGDCILCALGGKVNFANIEFGAANIHIHVTTKGIVNALGPSKAVSNANEHWLIDTGGACIENSVTIDLSGRTFGIATAVVTNGGTLDIPAVNFLSAGTLGKRFTVDGAGVIHTGTNSTNPPTSTYIPGNAPGTVTSPGFYS